MKTSTKLIACLLVLSLASSCSKKDSSPEEVDTTPDRSNCLLSTVTYADKPEMPYSKSNLTLKYDAEKRIIQQSGGGNFTEYIYQPGKIITKGYINSINILNQVSEDVFTLGVNDSRITERVYRDIGGSYTDKTVYEYNAEGYLTGKKLYKYGGSLASESKFSYENGNLVTREDIYYGSPARPTDKVYYKYDNTAFFPEAVFLPEVTDVQTGKPNKNNIVEITVEKTSINGWSDTYKTIQYSYTAKGKRLAEVKMTATTAQGKNITSSISFDYSCP